MKSLPTVLRCGLLLFLLSPADGEQTDKPSASPKLTKRFYETVLERVPKFSPVAPSPTSPLEGPPNPEIVRLPDVQVLAPKEAPVSNDAFLSNKGRLDKALKDNPGLKLSPFSSMNNGIALEMRLEAQEEARRNALKATGQGVLDKRDPRSRETLKLIDSALIRQNTQWLDNSAGAHR